MLYKSKILTLVTLVYSWYGYEYCFMGQSGPFYSYIYIYIYLLMLMIGTCGSWVELPVQRRLCLIFVNCVGLPDIHEYSAS